ncbi:MAG TPA: hypothetical protein VF006_10000 [Longimicrobium sp.]
MRYFFRSNRDKAPGGPDRRVRKIEWVLLLWQGFGLSGIWLFSYATAGKRVFVNGTLGSFIGGGAYMTGFLVGFLFGIPRSAAHAGAAEEPAERPAEVRARLGAGLRANTNLERVSDWLTKIIVGVGLVHLGQIGPAVKELSAHLAPGLGGGAVNQAFVSALLIYFVVCGFFSGYFWTRIFLSVAFVGADRQLVHNTADG